MYLLQALSIIVIPKLCYHIHVAGYFLRKSRLHIIILLTTPQIHVVTTVTDLHVVCLEATGTEYV